VCGFQTAKKMGLEPAAMPLATLLRRCFAFYLVAWLVLPVGANGYELRQSAAQVSTDGSGDGHQSSGSASYPDSPGTMLSQANAPVQQAQASQPLQQNPSPLGTAAAPDIRAEGSPASTPAGAAIAPAKQRRIHKFAVRTALVVGAAVAVGVVVALSVGSPSRPQ
jgi:hypothetical protein